MTQAWRDVDREALCPRCHRLVSLQEAGEDVRLAPHLDQTRFCLGSQIAVALNAPRARAAGEVLQAIFALCEEALLGEATDWNEGLRSVRALAERSLAEPPQDRRPRAERLFAAALRNQQPQPEDPMHPDHDPERLSDEKPRPEGPSAPARPSAPGPSSPASPEDADRSDGGRPDPTP